MVNTPFGPYDGGYSDESEVSTKYESPIMAELSKADELYDLISELDEDEDTGFPPRSDSTTVSEPPAPATQSPAPEKTPSVQARFLSGLVDRIVAEGKLLLTEDGGAFAYQEDGGYYKPVTKLEAYLANMLPSKTTRSLLSRNIREIAERLSWETSIQCNLDSYNSNPKLMNLQNGVFNLETSELMEHDPSYRFTYQVHASYLENPSEVSCPAFERFCKTSLDGNAMKRELLLEVIGYICTDTNAGKCALFFKGQPNSGKSVVSSLAARLFDKELVSNIPLHQLADRFFRAELAGKKLNVAGELAGRALRDISIFKSITGNDRIAGEFKGRDPFYFTPRCKLLFSGNTLPLTTETDATAAFVNRIRVLLFNNSIPPEKQDKRLADELWSERDSIVTLALQTVQRLIKRNFEFTQPEDSKKFLDSFTLRGNVLGGFLAECCDLDPAARVFNTDLYDAYVTYCKRNGLEAVSKQVLYDLLSGVPGVYAKRVRIGTENRQGHVGIALKEGTHTCGTLEQRT